MRPSLFALVLGLLVGCGSVSNRGADAANTCEPACGAHATCQGTSCACDTGFMGDGHTCADVNECTTGNGGCDANATCTNTMGGRTCACQAGFVGDGMTCRAAFVRVAMLPGVRINPDNFGGLAVGVGAKLYFGPRSNDPTQLYMRSYDVGTNAISQPLAFPPGTQTDFCACGLTSVFLSDGTTLYLLGNSGEKYNPATNAWSAVASYTAATARGEAAGTYDAASNLFLLVGGRGNEGSAERMALVGEAFSAEPGSLPVGMSSARAFTPPGAPVTYVAGGDLGMGVALLSHTTGSNGWTRLANAPQNLGRPIGMGSFMGQIWVARNGGTFYFYNPMNDTWAPNSIKAPTGTAVATMVAGQTFVLVDTGSATEIHRLNAIQ
ncbi:MAG: hypothetical protein E6J91_51355 [Deltaproteobacteria bacterium]|nr:MAG: hypothetical protein E6J91_51355 [Deltaproteobacteria bacterium]